MDMSDTELSKEKNNLERQLNWPMSGDIIRRVQDQLSHIRFEQDLRRRFHDYWYTQNNS